MGKSLLTAMTGFYLSDDQIDCLNASKLKHYLVETWTLFERQQTNVSQACETCTKKLNRLNIYDIEVEDIYLIERRWVEKQILQHLQVKHFLILISLIELSNDIFNISEFSEKNMHNYVILTMESNSR